MIDKISNLVETIRKECPHGCSGLLCSECPLQYPESPIGHEICEMFSKMETMFHDVDIHNKPEDTDHEARKRQGIV